MPYCELSPVRGPVRPITYVVFLEVYSPSLLKSKEVFAASAFVPEPESSAFVASKAEIKVP